MDGIQTDTTTLGQSEPGSNGNEDVLYTPQSYGTKASLSETVLCHTQDKVSFWKLEIEYTRWNLFCCLWLNSKIKKSKDIDLFIS